MPRTLLVAMLICGMASSLAEAGLIHTYDFSPDAPLADDAGGVELVAAEEVSMSPEGYASFNGSGGHLFAEELSGGGGGGIYTVSFWIRSDNYQADESGEVVEEAGILAATDINPFMKGNWGVGLRRGEIRFGGKTLDDGMVNQALIEKPVPGIWHLITLQFNGTEGGGAWVDEEPYMPFVLFRPTEGAPPPSFKDIKQFLIGTNFQRKTSFSGDIADIRIYDDVDWDEAKQGAAYQAGPSLGAPAAGQ